MKLLFDENLSRKLAFRLSELYPDSRHVSDVELLETPDRAVWEHAKANGFAIVTADADFCDFAANLGRRRRSFGFAAGAIPQETLRTCFAARQSGSPLSLLILNLEC